MLPVMGSSEPPEPPVHALLVSARSALRARVMMRRSGASAFLANGYREASRSQVTTCAGPPPFHVGGATEHDHSPALPPLTYSSPAASTSTTRTLPVAARGP